MKEFIIRFLMARGFLIWLIIWWPVWVSGMVTSIDWFYLISIPGWLALVGWFILRRHWICICPNCEKHLEPNERHCPKCGSPTIIRRRLGKVCPNGHKVEEEFNFYSTCPKCGKPLGAEEISGKMERKEKKKIEELIKEKQKEMAEGAGRLSKVMEILGQLSIDGYEEELWLKASQLKNSPGAMGEIEKILEKISKQREEEKKEIEKLIAETKKWIEEMIPKAAEMKDQMCLIALRVVEGNLPEISQQFRERGISYSEAKQKILDLQEQLKILGPSLPVEENYYQILGVSGDASQEEIKKAFRERLMEYHPDHQPPGSKEWVMKEATEKTKKICEAAAVLGDPEKRKEYDERLGIRKEAE